MSDADNQPPDLEANRQSGTLSSTSSHSSIASDSDLPNVADMVNYKPQKWQVLPMAAFALLAMVSNLFVLSIIHDIVGHEALPDLVFSLVPESLWVWEIADPMLTTLLVFVNIMIIFHRYRWVIWRRWLFCLGVLYSLRALTLATTQLPSSFVNNTALCKPFYEPFSWDVILDRFFNQILIGGMQSGDDRKLCGALMFSGHTIQFTTCAMMLTKYTKRNWRVFRTLVWIISYIGMFFMIISRSHYTVDVLIAYWLSVFVFTYYHVLTELPFEQRHYSIVHKLWLSYPIQFLERKTPAGIIPNEIEWPFNRPKSAVNLFARINSFRFKTYNTEAPQNVTIGKQQPTGGIDNQNYRNDELSNSLRQIQLSNI